MPSNLLVCSRVVDCIHKSYRKKHLNQSLLCLQISFNEKRSSLLLLIVADMSWLAFDRQFTEILLTTGRVEGYNGDFRTV